jgi:hypothetical protein
MVRRWLGFSIGLGLWFAVGPTLAQSASARVSLSWSAPAECPARTQLEAEVAALLGQSLPSSGEQALAIVVSVQGDPRQGYAAKGSFESPRGNDVRYLDHADCGQLVHAFALVIALTIDPERVRAIQGAHEPSMDALPPAAKTAAPEPAATPLPAAQPTPTWVPERNSEPAAARSLLHGARAALHVLAGTGPLPGLGAGLQATLGFHRRHARVEVVGRYWFPREAPVDEPPALKLELGLSTIGARACWQPLSGAWQLAACAGGDLGELRGGGSGGLENGHTEHAGYSQLAAGIQAAYTRGWLAPELGFELSAALARPTFGVLRNSKEDPLFQAAAYGFCAFLGVALEP